jgi:hypothetical protein
MAWDNRIISLETAVWEGHLPKDNIFSITKVHPGSIAQAAGIEPGQYYDASGDSGAEKFWSGLAMRGALGEVVSRIFDTSRKQCIVLRTKGFPWGMRLETPHFKLCADLRRARAVPETMADRIMSAPEPLFRELADAALRGVTWSEFKRVLLTSLGWPFNRYARANVVIEEMLLAAAAGAILKGDVAKAQNLLPPASRNLLVSRGSSVAGLYMYTAGLIAARAGKPRDEAVDHLQLALHCLPDCERVKDALRVFDEPVPAPATQADSTFPVDYRLPAVDPRLAVPGPDCRSVGLFEELARLRTDQIALVVLLGSYRSNGFYSQSMEMLGHLYPVIGHRLGIVHVITSALGLSDKDRAFTERWMRGEEYALTRGVPLVVLTDGEDTICNALGITKSPSCYLLGRDGSVLVENSLDDDGPIWEAFAKLDSSNRAAERQLSTSPEHPANRTEVG